MNKKNITIIVGVIVVAIIIVLLILFGNKKYTVEFDSKGGSTVTSQEVKRGASATRPADPTREGYIFDNWYFEDVIYDFSTEVKKNIKLEARWLGESETDKDGSFTITFNTDGGSKIDPVKVAKDGTITKPADPTREGYKFVEWQYNGKAFDFKTKVTANMVLKAVWESDDSQSVSKDPTTKKTTTKNTTKNTTKAPTTKPEKPKPTEPTEPPKKNYTASCEAISGSTLEQCKIVIKDQDGNYVSGTVRVETVTGGSGNVSTGYTLPKSSFKNATVISVN